jgi:hypothetical protein
MAASFVDDRVLIRFPGCAGNMSFFCGVMHVLRARLDFSKVSFLTRSATAFPVMVARSRVDGRSAFRLWMLRVRSYFERTGDRSTRQIGVAVYAHVQSVLGQALVANDAVGMTHHVEIVGLPSWKRVWVSEFASVTDYTDAAMASSHIPHVIGPSLTTSYRDHAHDIRHCIDGCLWMPLVTRMQETVGKTQYRASVRVVFEGSSTRGRICGLFMPEFFAAEADAQFEQGVQYAWDVLRPQLAALGVHFSDEPAVFPAPADMDHTEWSPIKGMFVAAETESTYNGPWWLQKLFGR